MRVSTLQHGMLDQLVSVPVHLVDRNSGTHALKTITFTDTFNRICERHFPKIVNRLVGVHAQLEQKVRGPSDSRNGIELG